MSPSKEKTHDQDQPVLEDSAEAIDPAADPANAEPAEPENEIEDLRVALAEAREQVNSRQEEVLRVRAEMENLRKRNARDMDKARKFALERIMGDLLNVADSLERGLQAGEAEQATVEQLLEGTVLTLKSLQQVMDKHGLVEINPVGEKFDPEHHEALSMVPTDQQDPETVVVVVQKGYLLNERLLRPARVLVAQAV